MPRIWSIPFEPFYSKKSGIDPAIDWVLSRQKRQDPKDQDQSSKLGPGASFYFVRGDQKEWLPVVIELSKKVTPKEFREGKFLKKKDKRAWDEGMIMPDFYLDPPTPLKNGRFCTATVKARVVGIIRELVPEYVLRIELSLPLRLDALPVAGSAPGGDSTKRPRSRRKPSPLKSSAGPQVSKRRQRNGPLKEKIAPVKLIVGVIDDGIAFAHERFRIGLNSRVEFWWQQDGPVNGPHEGCRLDRAKIDQLLKDCSDSSGALDEDLVYVRAGLIDYRKNTHKSVAWRIAHGTHVLDTAAGYNNGRDDWDKEVDRPIIVVQLPTATTHDTSGATLSKYVLDAIYYIMQCAEQLAGAGPSIPVIINLSYGVSAALYHDSGCGFQEPLEAAIDYVVRQYKCVDPKALEVVLPAGNNHLSRGHAQWKFTKKISDYPVEPPCPNEACVILRWRILPDDRSVSLLYVTLPRRQGGGTDSGVELTVTTPGGIESMPIGETRTRIQGPGCVIDYVPRDLVTGTPAHFKITVAPTADDDHPTEIAAAGIWKTKIRNLKLGSSDADSVHAYIQRDDTPYGYPLRGRQSYFDHDCYQRFDETTGRILEADNSNCIVRRSGLLNAIARGNTTVVLGGFFRKERVAAEYSSGGPTDNPNRESPDAMCVSEDSKIHRGMFAAGSRSGSTVAMGGTSNAVPRATRRMAKWVTEEGEVADRNLVQEKAALYETRDPDPPPPPAERSGAGRIPLDQIVYIATKRFEID
jgi:hypothetical protein